MSFVMESFFIRLNDELVEEDMSDTNEVEHGENKILIGGILKFLANCTKREKCFEYIPILKSGERFGFGTFLSSLVFLTPGNQIQPLFNDDDSELVDCLKRFMSEKVEDMEFDFRQKILTSFCNLFSVNVLVILVDKEGKEKYQKEFRRDSSEGIPSEGDYQETHSYSLIGIVSDDFEDVDDDEGILDEDIHYNVLAAPKWVSDFIAFREFFYLSCCVVFCLLVCLYKEKNENSKTIF